MNEETKTPETLAAMRAALREILARTNNEKARDPHAAIAGGILEIHDIANTALAEFDRTPKGSSGDADWKRVCAACAEGTPPERCVYYGEPGGCNAPKLGQHPDGNVAERLQEKLEKAERRIAELERAPGNAAALREALEQAKRDHWYDMSPDLRNKIFAALSAPLEPPSNAAATRAALSDLVYNIEIRAKAFGIFSIVDKKTWLDAQAVLSAPARNCDRFATAKEARVAFMRDARNTEGLDHLVYLTEIVGRVCKWLFAPAKGGDHA